jgi:hypothetical protein
MAERIIGAKVKLLRDHVTQGGTKFRAGVIMRVVDADRAGLKLCCYVRGWREDLWRVNRHDVLIVEPPKKDE